MRGQILILRELSCLNENRKLSVTKYNSKYICMNERGVDFLKGNKKIIILAVIIGLITIFALNYYLTTVVQEDPAVQREQEQASVVVAVSNIPQHTRITGEMVIMKAVFVDAVHPDALRKIEDAVGGISRSEIVRDEQVLSSRVATEEMRASLSYRIPEAMRAMAISTGEVSGVSGYISPGDRVDILVSYSFFTQEQEDEETGANDILTTYTTMQNVQVIATGGLTHEVDNEERNIVPSLTLLVTPEQAEVLAYASLEGSLHLTLRSPLDEEIVDLDYYNIENFETFRER